MSDSVRRPLSSWKEIAEFLGVCVRTAQSYAKDRGLPVYRLEGKRALVYSYEDELERWRRSGSLSDPEPEPPQPSEPTRFVRSWWLAVALTLTAGALVAPLALTGARLPAGHRVDGNVLVVLDKDGRELWRKVFPEGLGDYESVRSFPAPPQRFWVGDLDQDGSVEVLFVQLPEKWGGTHNALICYSRDGSERWRFVPGREVETAAHKDESLFNVLTFAVDRMRSGTRIVVSSCHFQSPSAQVAMLSPDGDLLNEYWHAGHLPHIGFADFDRDGEREIYLGGVNNAAQSATVVVLDRDAQAGVSRGNGALGRLARGESVRARILFPPSCLSREAHTYPGMVVMLIRDDRLLVHLDATPGGERHPVVTYRLGLDLSVQEVAFSDLYRSIHAELQDDKRLDHGISIHDVRSLSRLRRVE